ncbi:hypothetical protein JAAARDRAFT_138517 [Jaapia argillacea MUCL 33604]|uniref:Uncharacterized protein n=1 Tax=Jaapia argillacea MUCL 33604 TaxID=933084 RepID=A0A067PFF3_9AGAM|nr:hypothetical protein JAAARDRAFT_138517 [Jaapia argillacea MUCL 33604]
MDLFCVTKDLSQHDQALSIVCLLFLCLLVLLNGLPNHQQKATELQRKNTAASSESTCTTWTSIDETTLINFLKGHHTKAGDGMNFKSHTWKAASKEVDKCC